MDILCCKCRFYGAFFGGKNLIDISTWVEISSKVELKIDLCSLPRVSARNARATVTLANLHCSCMLAPQTSYCIIEGAPA